MVAYLATINTDIGDETDRFVLRCPFHNCPEFSINRGSHLARVRLREERDERDQAAVGACDLVSFRGMMKRFS